MLLGLCLVLVSCGTVQDSQAPESAAEGSRDGGVSNQEQDVAVEEPEEALPEEPSVRREDITTMEELLAYVAARHQAVEKPQVDFQDYIMGSADALEALGNFMQEVEFRPGALTLEEVEQDMDALFGILQSTYGMYYYLGGDEVFLPLKERILEDAALLEGEESLTGEALQELLLSGLKVIEDGHFRINGYAIHDAVRGHIYSGMDFLPEEAGFRERDGDRLVESVEGHASLEELFQMSIAQDGALVYHPVVLAAGEPEDLTVYFRDGTEETLSPAPWASHYEDSERTVELRYNGDVPVIFVRSMGFDQAKNDPYHGKEFLETAEQVKDEPVIVVDLRSNYGGNGLLPIKWFLEVTGQEVPTNFLTLNYLTEESIEEYGNNTENPTYTPIEEFEGIGGWERIDEYYVSSYGKPDRFVENDQLIILLTGKNTGSAAEIMVDLAHNLDNTLIVGSNTYGTLVSNAFVVVHLPNSGISVQLGSMLSIFPDDYFEEFVGFVPDIWTDGDAEELVMKLLEQYPR